MGDELRGDVIRTTVQAAAARQRARRARKARGLVVLHVEVDEVAVSELLIAAEYMGQSDADSRAHLEAALGAYLADVSAT